MTDERPQIHVPQLCQRCQLDVLTQLKLGPADAWRSAIVVLNIAAFQAATADRRVWERCGKVDDDKRETEDLSLVLAEIGCLGCFLGPKIRKLVDFARDNGLSELAQVTRDGDRMKAFVESL